MNAVIKWKKRPTKIKLQSALDLNTHKKEYSDKYKKQSSKS